MKNHEHNPSSRRHGPRHSRAACKRVFLHLSEFLDGELGKLEGQKLERHLKQCRPCLAYLDSLQVTIAACRQYGKAQSWATPRRLLARLERLLAITKGKPRAHRTSASARHQLSRPTGAPERGTKKPSPLGNRPMSTLRASRSRGVSSHAL